MTDNSQETSPDQVNEIWNDDKFDRTADADRLELFINNAIEGRKKHNRPAHLVLNLNSPWGGGKTFFLTKFAKQIKAKNGSVIYVDAWATDHASDPLVPILATLDRFLKDEGLSKKLGSTFQKIKKHAAPILLHAALGAGKQLAKSAIGTGVEEIGNLMGNDEQENSQPNAESNNDASPDVTNSAADAGIKAVDKHAQKAIEDFQTVDRSVAAFKSALADTSDALHEQGKVGPLIILIDELDRCRPTYAIEMLERAKHLFQAEGVVFVIATDTGELQHSIGAVYGKNFNSQRYLHRFFDQTVELSQPTFEQLITDFIDAGRWGHFRFELEWANEVEFMSKIFGAYYQNARDVLRTLETVERLTLGLEPGCEIHIPLLLPLIIANRTGIDIENRDAMNEFLVVANTSVTIIDMDRVQGGNSKRVERPIQKYCSAAYQSMNLDRDKLFELTRNQISSSKIESIQFHIYRLMVHSPYNPKSYVHLVKSLNVSAAL